MNTFDKEISFLQARISTLEAMKANVPPIKSVDELLIGMRLGVDRDKWREKESPVLTARRIMRKSELEMLESIVLSLNQINARLDRLEGSTS
jgi:hypothetical protein